MDDEVEFAWHAMEMELRCLRATGQGWQDVFSDVMEISRPSDFVRVRAGGPDGDLKCDGFLQSNGTIYQCYGPRQVRDQPAVSKITHDFEGALERWGEKMRAWCYVNNAPDGITGTVIHHLTTLNALHDMVTITPFGLNDLRVELRRASRTDRIRLLGQPPSSAAIASLRRDDLAGLIQQIGQLQAPAEPDLRPVPVDKMQHNQLSDDAQTLLVAGNRKLPLVRSYFENHFNPQYRDEVAARMTQEYVRLRAQHLAADDIFSQLQAFVGGTPAVPTASHQAAVLAIVTYFFSECDIFERPATRAS